MLTLVIAIFAIASFIYIKAQTGQVVPAILVAVLSPLVFLCLNAVVTMCVVFITTAEIVLSIVPIVFAVACLVFAIKYAMDKKKAECSKEADKPKEPSAS